MTSNLFHRIEQLVIPCEGWCTVHKAHTLASMVVAHRPKVVVELGLFCGRSFLPMAMACKEVNAGVCVGIDSWDAKVSAENESPDNAEWWKNVNHEEIYQKFMARIAALEVQSFCKIIRSKSDDVQPIECGLLHIDGSHTIQAKVDCERFAPKVVRGGLLVLDDISWGSGAVSEAYKHAISIGFKELYRVSGKEEITVMENDWVVLQRI